MTGELESLGIKSPMSVSELVTLVRRGLEDAFDDIAVQGEIRDLRRPASGHLYFTLAGESAQIRCVLFRSRGRLLRFEPQDGQSTVVRGQVTVYEPRGDLQMILEYMEPIGIGALMLALEQLKAKLAEEGLFDEQRKITLPELPEAVGVVTSETGAAIQDIFNVIENGYPPGLPIVLSPALVQGEDAAKSIAGALDRLVEHAPEVEVIIVGRGGGSFEDLFPFNEEPVVRAISRCPIPVISAVGHEIDWTLSDMVADVRAPTPTAAAQLVIQDWRDIRDRLDELQDRSAYSIRRAIQDNSTHVQSLTDRLVDPRRMVERTAQRLDDLSGLIESSIRGRLSNCRTVSESLLARLQTMAPSRRTRQMERLVRTSTERLEQAAHTRLSTTRQRLDAINSRLRSSGPPAILKRGYAIVRDGGGRLVKNAGVLKIDDKVRITLAKGGFLGRVEEIDASHGADGDS